MKLIKNLLLLGSLAVILIVVGTKYNLAQEVNVNSPVRIFAPKNGAPLLTGQSFILQAEINPQHFHFEPKIVEVELFNVQTKFSHTWSLNQISSSSSFKINQSLELPNSIPPGNDDYYRLSVRGLSIDKTTGLGFVIPVEVIDSIAP